MDWECPFEEIKVGIGRKLYDKTIRNFAENNVAILTIGPIGNDALSSIKEIEQEGKYKGRIAHYDMRFLKPIDESILEEVGKNFKHIITIEDGVRNGGLGTAVMEWLNDHEYFPHIQRLGIPDKFIEQGTVQQLRQICGIDKENIKQQIENKLQKVAN